MKRLLFWGLCRIANSFGCVVIPADHFDNVWEDEPINLEPMRCLDAHDAFERLRLAASGRDLEVWIPIGLERRLRAALHRMNADMACSGYGEDDQFDLEVDLQTALVSAANYGVLAFENQDHVKYDDLTGYPLDDPVLLREEN